MGIDLTAAARVVPLTTLTSDACVSRSTYDKQTAVLQQARAQAILPLAVAPSSRGRDTLSAAT